MLVHLRNWFLRYLCKIEKVVFIKIYFFFNFTDSVIIKWIVCLSICLPVYAVVDKLPGHNAWNFLCFVVLFMCFGEFFRCSCRSEPRKSTIIVAYDRMISCSQVIRGIYAPNTCLSISWFFFYITRTEILLIILLWKFYRVRAIY